MARDSDDIYGVHSIGVHGARWYTGPTDNTSAAKEKKDAVNNPVHYTSHPSGVECIQVVEHMNFNLGNAIKYIWRASLKGKEKQDLEKAAWYINREIQRVYGKK